MLLVFLFVRVFERSKLVSSEVTNRDDNHLEEDIPEEIIVDDNCSEHSTRYPAISLLRVILWMIFPT